jgi:hypothetical protein
MDSDAAAYIANVEAADTIAGSPGGLEEKTKIAIDDFVLGCKADGIWNAIKASCILAGARTLSGALVPLVGTAPTNNNFVSGDYNRKTGLVGDGSTKYLNSNRNNNADPQNNQHLSAYTSSSSTGSRRLIGSSNNSGGSIIASTSSTSYSFRSRNNAGLATTTTVTVGFVGMSRNTSSDYLWQSASTNGSFSQASQVPENASIEVFRAALNPTDTRLAFYSIGESINLTALDARVTTLINAFAASIP